MKAFLQIKDDGAVDELMSTHAKATIHSVQTYNGDVLLTVKFAGRNYWAARGEQRYTGAELVTYRVLGRRKDGIYATEQILRVPVRPETAPDEVAAFLDNRFLKASTPADD